MALPRSRTIILIDAGTVSFSEALAVYDGAAGATPTPVPSPSFVTAPSITNDGTPQVGELLTGNSAITLNLGAASVERAWLAGSTMLSTNADYTPGEAGTLTFRNQIVLAGIVLASVSVDIVVGAATVTPTPGEGVPIPTPVISIVNPGDNPPAIAIAPDTYLTGDHFLLDRWTNEALTEGFYRDDHVLTDDEIGAGDVTFASLVTLPPGTYWRTGTVVRNGVTGTRGSAVSNTVAGAAGTYTPVASFADPVGYSRATSTMNRDLVAGASLLFFASDDQQANSMTRAGVAAAQAVTTNSNGSWNTSIWIVPTMAAGAVDIAATFNYDAGVTLGAAAWSGKATPTDTLALLIAGGGNENDNADRVIGDTLTIPPGGVGVFTIVRREGGNEPILWRNATKDSQVSTTNVVMSTAHVLNPTSEPIDFQPVVNVGYREARIIGVALENS